VSPETRDPNGRGTILLIVTGSIAAFKAAALASKLTQDGFEVRTVLSPGALEFVRPATFEGLTGSVPFESTFADGDAMAHIDLARWADLTLVYPASANSLTKFAHGAAGDLIGTLFLAMNVGGSEAERNAIWVAPAMNPTMLAHPAVREAIQKLSGWGIRVLESGDGRMACGETGVGRLIEPEEMLTKIRAFFGMPTGTGTSVAKVSRESAASARSSLKGRRILVTAGATSEPVVPVRVLTNVSTGETGVRVANSLADAGAHVTLLISNSSPFRARVREGVQALGFDTFGNLDDLMREQLSTARFDTLIHAAAVSDYAVDRIEDAKGAEIARTRKIRTGEGLRLVLKPNPKILDRVREYSGRPDFRVVSFKLSASGGKGAPDLSGYSSDWIVHNAAEGIERGTEKHGGEIFARASGKKAKQPYQPIAKFETKDELCRRLVEILTPAVAPGKKWFRTEDMSP
jgi:phosphopantothenoylcysteine decarboxylase/phosphopantothenate--cysteine ligase